MWEKLEAIAGSSIPLRPSSIFLPDSDVPLFWWPFLVINHKFQISPLFSLFQYISSPVSRKLLFPPTFTNFPSVLEKLTCFYILFVYFVAPLIWPWCIYASPNARTGRPWEPLQYNIWFIPENSSWHRCNWIKCSSLLFLSYVCGESFLSLLSASNNCFPALSWYLRAVLWLFV